MANHTPVILLDDFVYFGGGQRWAENYAALFSFLGFEVYLLNLRRPRNQLELLKILLPRMLGGDTPLILLNGFRVTCFLGFFLFFCDNAIPVVHTSPILSKSKIGLSRYFMMLLRRYEKFIVDHKKSIFVSKAVMDSFDKTLGVDAWIFRSFIFSNADCGEKPKSCEGLLRVGFLGRLEAEKGVLTLIDAVLQGDGLSLKLGGVNRLKRPFNNASGHEAIRFKGFVRDLDEFFRDIDVLCLPSVSEGGVPFVVIEAALRKVPTIATALPVLSETFKDGVSILLLPDGVSLNQYLRGLVEDRNALEMIGHRAAQVVNVKHSVGAGFNSVCEFLWALK